MTTSIRAASNSDCQQIIELIDSVLGEWNDRVCLEDAEQDLLDIESSFHANGGDFVVMENDGEIIGTHGALPVVNETNLVSTCTLKRLYVKKSWRGTDVGKELMQWAVDWAQANGYRKIEFWSDSRFNRAHRFFEKMGFQKGDQVREMCDSFDPYQEFYFSMNLESLDDSHVRQ